MVTTMRHAMLTLLLAALGGCGSGASEDDAAKPIATIRTAAAGSGTMIQQAALYGTIEPASGGDAAITAPMEATVGRLMVANGSHVGAGQAIAQLSASATSRLDLARLRVDATTAAAALARAERLRADGLMSDADLEAARSAARAAALGRDSLAARTGQLLLRAPFAGSVEGLVAHQGDLLAMGATLAHVVAGDRLRVRFGIDPSLASRAHVGMPIVIAPGGGGTPITTTVASIDPIIDPATRQASLIAALPPGTAAAPGEIVEATLDIAGSGNSVTIPYTALLDDGGDSYVFVIANGVAHRREVKPGQVHGDSVAITSGVRPGERVAISGGTALDEGMRVREAGNGK